jgi:antitoxin HicB
MAGLARQARTWKKDDPPLYRPVLVTTRLTPTGSSAYISLVPLHDFGRQGPMSHVYKIPLVLTPQPEGGFIVQSPVLPELVTEGDSLEEALEHVKDAIKAVVETYEDRGQPLPPELQQGGGDAPISFDWLIDAA